MTRTIDMGDDIELVEFRIGGKAFTCFPLDELDIIHGLADQESPPAMKGEPFLLVVQRRLQAQYAVTASLAKSGEWYQKLHDLNEEQKVFFGGSPASSGATGSTPAGEDSANSDQPKSVSSTPSGTPSRRKRTQKRSAT